MVFIFSCYIWGLLDKGKNPSVSPFRAFPWVLEVFGVSAYHFYRLIELVIKVEGSFPRSIIKHLNRVGAFLDTYN